MSAPRPRKSLGQHYLTDTGALLGIAESVRTSNGGLHGTTLEIGPGPGGLTAALLQSGAEHVVAIERDERFRLRLEALAALPETGSRLTLLWEDARKVPLSAVEGARPLRVAANLPYNVSTILLVDWMRELSKAHSTEGCIPQSFTLMFQEEVAQRIVAQAGEPHYGRLSVLCGWLTERALLTQFPPSSFSPPPRVESRLVRLLPRAAPLAPAPLEALETVVRIAFGGRRKMLRRAYARMPCGAEPLLEAAGLTGEERAETVSIESYCAMARTLAEHSAEPF